MNVYRVVVKYNEPTEAEIVLAAENESEARENLTSYLVSIGFIDVAIMEVQYLSDAANYVHNEPTGVYS